MLKIRVHSFFNSPGYTGVKFKGRQTVRSVAGYPCRHSSAFSLLLAQPASHSTTCFKVGETERSERGREKPTSATLQDHMHGPLPCKGIHWQSHSLQRRIIMQLCTVSGCSHLNISVFYLVGIKCYLTLGLDTHYIWFSSYGIFL